MYTKLKNNYRKLFRKNIGIKLIIILLDLGKFDVNQKVQIDKIDQLNKFEDFISKFNLNKINKKSLKNNK